LFVAILQDYADVSALVYTLRVVLGDGGLPTRPPTPPPNSKLTNPTCRALRMNTRCRLLLPANGCFAGAILQDYADVSALLYTLRVVLGDADLPTKPTATAGSMFFGMLIACPL
jgi:hypothetical protein